MELFLRYDQICDEKLPLVKIRKTSQKVKFPYLSFSLPEIYKIYI